MPIRINLLSEALALEDLRRRDPVKRAVWTGAALAAVMLVGSIWLQLQIFRWKAKLDQVGNQLASRTNEYQAVLSSQRKLADVSRKLGALQQLANSRLLYGTVLNALQQSTIDDVQLMRFRADQTYIMAEEVKARTNEDDKITPGRPATVTEKILLTLEAKDSGPNPGDLVNKLKQVIVENPYFKTVLTKTNEVRLASLSPPQMPLDGKPFVLFTLECRYPEKKR